MSKSTITVFLCLLVCVAILAAGCKDKKTTQPTNTSSPIQMVDVCEVIEAAAPPEFVPPATSPADIDSIWLYGQYPLLGKVFGSNDPQTLYANVNAFKLSMEIIKSAVQVNEDGSFVCGTHVDSILVEVGAGDPVLMHYTATVVPVTGATALPANAQAVIGESVDIDYLLTCDVVEVPLGSVKIGVSLSDTLQTVVQWDANMGNETDNQSRIFFASLDPSDSSFVFKGVGYVLHATDETFTWAFNIQADAASNFAYRSSYFSNGTPGRTFLNCMLGGGNKDIEFALKSRAFTPADTNVVDSANMHDEVFGPNYSEGTGLITAYAEYLGDDLMIGYDAVPQAMIDDPWAE